MAAGYVTNQLNNVVPGMGGNPDPTAEALNAPNLWIYLTDTDAIATVIAAGYIDDGADKGMQVGDAVVCIDTNIPAIDLCVVSVVDVSSNASGDVTMIQLA